MALLYLRLTLVLVSVSVALSQQNFPGEVTVLKCCRHGEALVKPDKNQPRSEPVARCAANAEAWSPYIYSTSKRNMTSEIPAYWRIAEARLPECPENYDLGFLAQRIHDPFILFDTGHAVQLNARITYRPGGFCADSNGLLACVVRTENPAAATMKPRVHRCCGEDAAYVETDVNFGACVNTKDDPKAMPLLPNSSFVEIVPGFPECEHSDKFSIIGDTADGVLQPDGGLDVNGTRLPTRQFCVERIKDANAVKIFACSEHLPESPMIQATDIRFTLYPVGFIVSVVFLAATLAAGWLLPSSHHVLHWRCQTHHVVCLMLADLFMAIIQLAGDSIPAGSCKALAIMAHFFFLAAFFWLNTMCFNIWWTFRDLRPASLEKSQETVRLRVYACYAWGGPLLVAGLAALLDHLPSQPEYTFLRPRFGEKRCWFYGDMEILAYFYGPIGVLLAVNLLFFVATTRELTCGLWKGEFVKSTTERAALGRVCMKLVVVMGVTWVVDVISWAVGGPHYLWYFTDMINAFQGVLIFAVVGCQPQVWAAVKRFCNRNPRTNAGRQGNAMSTTSHGMPSMGDSVTQNPSTKTAPLETIC